MKGKVRTKEKCPICKQNFQPVLHPKHKDWIDLICNDHHTRPRNCYIDARDTGIGKIYTDEKGQRFGSFDVAHRELEEIRRQIDDKVLNVSDWKDKEYGFKTNADRWLSEIELNKSYSYIRHTRTHMHLHIFPVFKKFDVRDVRTFHIKDFYYYLLDKGLEPKTIKNILTTFKTFVYYLHNIDLIQRFPKFITVRVPQKAKGWISRQKQNELLYHMPEKHRLIFETLVETAVRPGEVCAFKNKDLVDGGLCIERAFDERGHVKEPKSGKVIYRGISLDLWVKLVMHSKDKLPESWLFLDEWQKPYSQGRLYDVWVRACEKASVKISLYAGTRHSRSSQKRLEKEKEIAEACRAELGHSSKSTTIKHYARSRKERI